MFQQPVEVHQMSQPNFHAMSQKELHNYVFAHHEDQETFYAYIDRLPYGG